MLFFGIIVIVSMARPWIQYNDNNAEEQTSTGEKTFSQY